MQCLWACSMVQHVLLLSAPDRLRAARAMAPHKWCQANSYSPSASCLSTRRQEVVGWANSAGHNASGEEAPSARQGEDLQHNSAGTCAAALEGRPCGPLVCLAMLVVQRDGLGTPGVTDRQDFPLRDRSALCGVRDSSHSVMRLVCSVVAHQPGSVTERRGFEAWKHGFRRQFLRPAAGDTSPAAAMTPTVVDLSSGGSPDASGEGAEHGHGASGGSIVIISFFIGLLSKNVLSRTKLPYTVILLLSGMLVGAIHASVSYVSRARARVPS